MEGEIVYGEVGLLAIAYFDLEYFGNLNAIAASFHLLVLVYVKH